MNQPLSAAPELAPSAQAASNPKDPAASSASPSTLPLCLISLVHADRGLSQALLAHLRTELPEIEFTFEEGRQVQAVWLCGFEPESSDHLRGLRACHPQAIILATRRGPLEDWEEGALSAGADHACAWPASYQELGVLLRQR